MTEPKVINKMVDKFMSVVLAEAEKNGRMPELASAIVRLMQDADPKNAWAFVDALLQDTTDSLPAHAQYKFLAAVRQCARQR